MSKLNEFKVEELEQRLEMGSWYPSTQTAPNIEDPFGTPWDTYYGATYTHTF